MTLYVAGGWTCSSGDTVVKLTDGSVWRQDEYHYEYHYADRPKLPSQTERYWFTA